MNDYSFEDIEIGHRESFSVEVTPQMMEQFCSITGDINPLHCDQAYAARFGHPDTVCYGMLTAAFLSTLAGVYIPGKKSLLREVDVKFMKSVYPGDVLEVAGEVAEKNDAYRVLGVKVAIRNQSGAKVARGKIQVGFAESFGY